MKVLLNFAGYTNCYQQKHNASFGNGLTIDRRSFKMYEQVTRDWKKRQLSQSILTYLTNKQAQLRGIIENVSKTMDPAHLRLLPIIKIGFKNSKQIGPILDVSFDESKLLTKAVKDLLIDDADNYANYRNVTDSAMITGFTDTNGNIIEDVLSKKLGDTIKQKALQGKEASAEARKVVDEIFGRWFARS